MTQTDGPASPTSRPDHPLGASNKRPRPDDQSPSTIATDAFFGDSLRTFIPPILSTPAARRRRLNAIAKSPENYMRLFATQADAFTDCDNPANVPKHLRVWACEIDSNGRRRFLTASYDAFWRLYSRMLRRAPARTCHYYEVIRERHAAKLYLDLELNRPANPNISVQDADGMTQAVIQTCLQVAGATSERHKQVMLLESTTEKKYSMHVIFQGVVFYDNVQMGLFISDVMSQLGGDQSLPSIMVNDKDGTKKVPLIDVGVYTKNRCFRLVGSSKFGKQARLLLPGNKADERVRVSRDDFLESLVCNVQVSAAREEGVLILGQASPPESWPGEPTRKRRTVYGGGGVGGNMVAGGGSAYGALDEYVMSIVGPAGGGIHSVTTTAAGTADETVAYAIKGAYKYCGRVGRHHRSNNVVLVVEVGRREMFQRCFDPECRGYRSVPWAIPGGALAGVMEEMEADSVDGGVSDDMMMEAVADI